MTLDDIQHQLTELFQQSGIDTVEIKDIAYGVQLRLTDGTWKGVFRIYQNNKGLIKYDYSQLPKGKASQQVIACVQAFCGEKGMPKEDRHFGYPIIGSDESGKGDYFGSLVCASVHVTETTAQELLAIGIRDSKNVQDQSAIRLAAEIESICPDQFYQDHQIPL